VKNRIFLHISFTNCQFLFNLALFQTLIPLDMMKNYILSRTGTLALLLLVLVLFSGCENREAVTGCLQGHTYGFWGGLLHGLMAPIDLIAMLFSDKTTVFAQNNNGAWYAFGFLIGSGGWGLLGGHGAKRRYRSK
jgi:hypothetical protein